MDVIIDHVGKLYGKINMKRQRLRGVRDSDGKRLKQSNLKQNSV